MREDAFRLLNHYINVSPEAFEKLSRYHDLLVKWQQKINLVGPDTIADAWRRHFLDSLQLQKMVLHHPRRHEMSTGDPEESKMDSRLSLRSPEYEEYNILDLGSGAGFPGMALAICGAATMHLVESDAKKITFLEEVARITETKVFIHHCRIEDQPVEKPQIIVSRACSNLDRLLHYVSPYVSHETICLFHKGKNYSKEIVDAKEQWVFDETVIPSVTDAQAVILKLAHVRKREHDR